VFHIISFNITFRYTDDAPLLNKFDDYLDRSHTIELVIKDMTNISRNPSYLYVHLEIDNECLLRTKLSDKRDDINSPNVNCLFICSNIPVVPTYGLYISQYLR
jgi:hypothetical protein